MERKRTEREEINEIKKRGGREPVVVLKWVFKSKIGKGIETKVSQKERERERGK